jgi:hypothetical protein
VLGAFHILTGPGNAGLDYDTGSTPAVAANGTIYAGSENGGIYRFNPADGSNTQIFAQGMYSGSSVIIGPDGTLYAGDLGGTVYAVNPDGSLRWASPPQAQCASGTPAIQSTGALDKNGTFYIGFGCFSRSTGHTGGVMAINSNGSVAWTATYQSTQVDSAGRPVGQTPGGAVTGAVVLSPDEKTLYVTDDAGCVAAIDIGSHNAKWVDQYPGEVAQASMALSPSGDELYVPFEPSDNPTVIGLTSFHTSDGSLDHSLGTTDGIASWSSPAVDAQGNVIYAYTGDTVVGYNSGLGSVRFKAQGELDHAVLGDIAGGPVIGPDGTIYVTGKTGKIAALGPNLMVPTFTPTLTPTPIPTDTVSVPTLTPPPTIAPPPPTSTPGPCSLNTMPLSATVRRGDLQAVTYVTSQPFSTIVSQFVTGGKPYPAQAVLAVVDPFGTISTVLTAMQVAGHDQFTFNNEFSGIAVLIFTVPAKARLGEVTVHTIAVEACGTELRSAHFKVVATTRHATSISAKAQAVTLQVPLPAWAVPAADRAALVSTGPHHLTLVQHSATTYLVLTLRGPFPGSQ